MGSTRLPGKTLKTILGKPTLELLLERLARAETVHEIIVATTTDSEDDAIEALCSRLGFGCFRGSSDDVLDRVVKAAASANADIIAEITGDCVLTCPEVVDDAVRLFSDSDYDFVSNLMVQTYPQGVDTRVFNYRDLAEINDHLAGSDPDTREHVPLHMEEHPERYKQHNMVAPPHYYRPEWRLDLDYPEDLELLTIIFGDLYPKNPEFDLSDLVEYLDANQHLRPINQDMYRKPVRPE